jgi:adenine-specific DNA-methyltransferase
VSRAKRLGQFFTPPKVAAALVSWAVRDRSDRILDPSCGDGEFLAMHEPAVGIELDGAHAAAARLRAPAALVHESDFFTWAAQTHERFEAVVGNPPFIRYQGFAGVIRQRALALARKADAQLPELASSWAPFVAASTLLLRPGGRIAFVVPAEIGHAAYSIPLIHALCGQFDNVTIVAVREKLFPALAEDAWLLFASGHGGHTTGVALAATERFDASRLIPRPYTRISLEDLTGARGRIRRWLLPNDVLEAYRYFEEHAAVDRLGHVADVNIGYVSGANDFFHLRPSEARHHRIPRRLLRTAVRRGASLPSKASLTNADVAQWIENDEPVMLLHITPQHKRLPKGVLEYLNSPTGHEVRGAYKCRVREPWYCVPDVRVPDAFLTYMSGERVQLVRNLAGCVATNSVHVVRMKPRAAISEVQRRFNNDLTTLSCEVEGHPLGGGMLKVEPREAQRILVPSLTLRPEVAAASDVLEQGVLAMKRWRHYA